MGADNCQRELSAILGSNVLLYLAHDPYHSHLYLQAVKLKLATPLSRLQVGLRARPLKAHYLRSDQE
jgi:hypothetical protein